MKRGIFFEVGGFDENLSIGEDFDFNNRLVNRGYTVKRCNVIEWHIGEPERLKDIAMKGYYNGAAFRRYYEKRKKLAVQQLNPFQPEVLKRLLHTPTLLLLSLVLVDMTRYIAAILGFLASSLAEVKTNSGTT
jgi:GT2 family glycosyltransferase